MKARKYDIPATAGMVLEWLTIALCVIWSLAIGLYVLVDLISGIF